MEGTNGRGVVSSHIQLWGFQKLSQWWLDFLGIPLYKYPRIRSGDNSGFILLFCFCVPSFAALKSMFVPSSSVPLLSISSVLVTLPYLVAPNVLVPEVVPILGRRTLVVLDHDGVRLRLSSSRAILGHTNGTLWPRISSRT